MTDETTTTTAEAKADEPSPELLTEAEGMGWQPKESYRGDPERWVDAATFVEKGRHVLPIITKNNERLHGELQSTKAEVGKLQELLKASQESIQALEEYHTTETARRVELAKKEVVARLKQARQENDVDAEVDLNQELGELNAAQAEAKKKPAEKKTAEPPPPLDAAFVQWSKENPWFGTDEKRTRLALAVGEEMRVLGDTRQGPTFLNDVTKQVEERLGGKKPNGATKVEGARGNGGGGGSAKKTFADLPAEARASCMSFSARLVGPGRRYKTAADWQAAYTTKYLEGESH